MRRAYSLFFLLAPIVSCALGADIGASVQAEAWGGKVLQVEIKQPGKDWVASDVVGLVNAHREWVDADIPEALVSVIFVDEKTRAIELNCKGKTVVRKFFSIGEDASISGFCGENQKRLTVVDIDKSRHPVANELPAYSLTIKKEELPLFLTNDQVISKCELSLKKGMVLNPRTNKEEFMYLDDNRSLHYCQYAIDVIKSTCLATKTCPSHKEWEKSHPELSLSLSKSDFSAALDRYIATKKSLQEQK